MTCKICSKEYKDSMAKFCIEKTEKCPDCYKKWCEQDENNAELTKYLVEYESNREDSIYVYAKSEKEAREQFEENYEGEFTDIIDITEVKREGFGNK